MKNIAFVLITTIGKRRTINKHVAHIWLDDIRTTDIPSGDTVVLVKDYNSFVGQLEGVQQKIPDLIVWDLIFICR